MKKFFKSLFTDGDWDFDITKIIGFILIIVGLVQSFLQLENAKWLIMTGAAAIASGKLSGNE